MEKQIVLKSYVLICQKYTKLMKISENSNIDWESIHIFWTAREISMKFLEKKWLMIIILETQKKQGLILIHIESNFIRKAITLCMHIASAKSQSARKTSHQPAFMDNFLIISHTCLPCLPSRWVTSCGPYCPIIRLMVTSLRLLCAWYGFSSMGSWCYSREWVWNSRKKLCYIASGKWNVSRVSLQKFRY